MDGLDEKARLRAELRARRRRLAAEAPEAADRAAQAYLRSGLGPFAIAAVYRPMGAELDPAPVAEILAAQGARIALPAAVRAGAPLVFRLDIGQELAPDAVGVYAPPPEAPTVHPDLVIAPLLAFDRFGGRLGQGGGFYDRTLEAIRRQGPVLAIGLAYAGQELDRIPTRPHDQRLDGVLTEAGLRLFAKES